MVTFIAQTISVQVDKFRSEQEPIRHILSVSSEFMSIITYLYQGNLALEIVIEYVIERAKKINAKISTTGLGGGPSIMITIFLTQILSKIRV